MSGADVAEISSRALREDTRVAPTPQTEPLWLPLVRFVVAVLLAAEVCRLLWSQVPSQLSIKTDIVGFPIFGDFNVTRYTDGYYIIAGLFPALVILIYLVVAWKGPLRRRRAPEVAMLPVAILDTTWEEPVSSVDRAPGIEIAAACRCTARVALVALAVALEVAVSQPADRGVGTLGPYMTAAAYIAVVAVLAALLHSFTSSESHASHAPARSAWTTSVARVNALAALCVVPLLYFVSRGTTVAVGSRDTIVRYPWFPLWLAVAATVIAFAAWYRGATRARSASDHQELEAKLLTWVVGPVLLFVVSASLPGAFGPFQGFDDAGAYTTPQLIFHHGLFPWRDLYAFHGLLTDALQGSVGIAIFGNSRWGSNAGISLIVNPLSSIALYAFVAYFCRKNRLIIVGFSIALVTGLLAVGMLRFMLVPFGFILLDQVLRRSGWVRCASLMFVLFAQAIITPESDLFVPAIFGTVVLFEWCSRRPDTSLSASFERTGRCLIAGAVLTGAWVIFLLGTHSLSAFVDFYLDFIPGHSLEGALPTQWNLGQDLMTTVEWVLPSILLLATIWRFVSKIRRRSSWDYREWVMVAVAICSGAYFLQALDRADPPHVELSYTIAAMLLILWIIDLLDRGDRMLGRALPSRFPLRHAMTTVAILAVLFAAAEPSPSMKSVSAAVRNVPSDFHKSVTRADIPAMKMLGYTVPGTVDTGQIQALGRVLDRYAGPSSPVFDYSNEPGVVYYLLNRVSGTQFSYAAVIQTPSAQAEAVSELANSRPRVVIFSNSGFGLTYYDGIPQSIRSSSVSAYLFDHYRPLLDVDSQLILLRDDLFATAPPIPAGTKVTDLYYDTPSCTFGDIPNFLSIPSSVSRARGVRVQAQRLSSYDYTVQGWATDAVTKRSATEVLAAVNGKVIANVPTGIYRGDVAASLHDPAASTSGYSMSLPPAKGPITLYAMNSNGTVSALNRNPRVAPVVGQSSVAEVTTPDGLSHAVIVSPTAGFVDTVEPFFASVYRVTPPVGTSFGSYSWLRVSSSASLRASSFSLTDSTSASLTHQIDFSLLPQAASSINVGVGSCLQWHGYPSSGGIYVTESGNVAGLRFSLIR